MNIAQSTASLKAGFDELKKMGVIREAGQPLPVTKNGFDLANLGAVKSQWMDVTPVLAARWLKNNFINRPMKEDVVKAYARDMINGVWQPTHQGIAFNDKDHLIDGQHRLAAIVMAKITVRMMVTFGLPSKIDGREMTTMDCVDRGATRSVADQLKIQHGMKDGSLIQRLAAALASICCGEKTRRLSVGQALDVYRAFEQPITYVIEHRSKHHGLRQIGFLSGFAFALATETGYWEGNTQMSEWFTAFVTGEKLEGKSPIALLRDFATGEEAKLFAQSMNRGLAELTLQAIYLRKAGARIAKLELAQDGADHFRKLQADRVKKIAEIFKLPVAKSVDDAAQAKQPAKVPVIANHLPEAGKKVAFSMEQIIQKATMHFGIDRRILLHRRASEETIVASRNCLFRCVEELGHGKAAIAAATGFSINDLTGILARFAEELKVNQKHARKYAAFRNKFNA